MNTEIISKAAIGTLTGAMSFPEVVGHLLDAGVEYYHVDYVGMRKTFYSADGGMVLTAIPYEGLPPVAAEFDRAASGRTFWTASKRTSLTASSRAGQWQRACRDTSPSCEGNG